MNPYKCPSDPPIAQIDNAQTTIDAVDAAVRRRLPAASASRGPDGVNRKLVATGAAGM
jgi:hypothetical protein